MSRTRHLILTACLLTAAGVLPACESHRNSIRDRDDVGFWIESSNNDIVAGEIVTVTANSRNTLGKDAQVKWKTTAGDLNTEANGRIARVRFDEPGAYTITGRLILDGTAVQEDSVDIKVRPVK